MMPFLLSVWKKLPFSKASQLRIMRLFHNQFLVAVSGVIFNERDEILLFKHSYRDNPWGLPGGYLQAGEHPKEGLEREIEEESGLIISIEDKLKIRTDRETARIEICYTGTFLGGDFHPSAEVESYHFYSFDSLPLLSSKNSLLLIQKAIEERKLMKKTTMTTFPNTLKTSWMNLWE